MQPQNHSIYFRLEYYNYTCVRRTKSRNILFFCQTFFVMSETVNIDIKWLALSMGHKMALLLTDAKNLPKEVFWKMAQLEFAVCKPRKAYQKCWVMPDIFLAISFLLFSMKTKNLLPADWVLKNVWNQSVTYQSVTYRSVTYQSVTYWSETYRSVTYRSETYQSETYPFFHSKIQSWIGCFLCVILIF